MSAEAQTVGADDSPANVYPNPAAEEMIDAGVFYGLKKTKTNPKMKQFVLMNRGGIEIFDLEKTGEAMEKAEAFLKEKIRQSGTVLLAGTQPAAERGVLETAKKLNLSFVVNRWPGGTITNFKEISKRIDYLKKLRGDFASGALNKYTKKERLELEREMNRLDELFGGMVGMTKVPDVLVVVDPNVHATAVREANRAGVPIIAFANVDADPDLVDCLVPGNDSAKKSIEWFLGKLGRAIEEGMTQRTPPASPANSEQSANNGREN